MAQSLLTSTDAGALARDKINAAILAGNDVQSNKLPTVQAAAQTAAAQAAGANASVVDLRQNAVPAAQRTADGAASAASSAAATALLAIAKAMPSNVRPGDGLGAYALVSSLAGLSGEADDLAPLTASRRAFAPAGGVVRLSGYGILAAREAEPIEPGRVREVRAAFTRFSNASDPSNDTVRFGLVWLDQAKNVLPGAPVAVVQDFDALTTGSGRKQAVAYVARSPAPGVTIVPPAGAVYYRRIVHNFGLDGITDVEVVAGSDVTGLLVPPTVTIDYGNRLATVESQDAGTRLNVVEQAVQNPRALTFPTLTDAVAASPPAGVTTIALRGQTTPGDGRGRDFRRASEATYQATAAEARFTTQDGARWVRSRLMIDPPGAAAVLRDWEQRSFETVSVFDYVHPEDGFAAGLQDLLPAFLRAVAYLGSIGGGLITVPAGAYAVSGEVLITYSNIFVAGAGGYATEIRTTHATAHIFHFYAPGHDRETGGVRDIGFNIAGSAGRTGGAAIRTTGWSNFAHSGIRSANQFLGVDLVDTVLVFADHAVHIGMQPGGGGTRIDGGNDHYLKRQFHVGNAGGQPMFGVQIVRSGGTWLDTCGGLQCGTGLLVNPGPGQVVEQCFFAHNAWDSNANTGTLYEPAGPGSIVRGIVATDEWNCTNGLDGLTAISGLDANGDAGAIQDILYVAGRALNNQHHGHAWLSGVDCAVDGLRSSGNSGAQAGNYHGLVIGAETIRFMADNIAAGQLRNFANIQGYGILVAQGASGFKIGLISDCPNVYGQILDLSITPFKYIPVKYQRSVTKAWSPGTIPAGGFRSLLVGLGSLNPNTDELSATFSGISAGGLLISAAVTDDSNGTVTIMNATSSSVALPTGLVRVVVRTHY